MTENFRNVSGNISDWQRVFDVMVVFIEENAQLSGEICVPVDPGVEASFVLEINGGLASSLGIGVGDGAYEIEIHLNK